MEMYTFTEVVKTNPIKPNFKMGPRLDLQKIYVVISSLFCNIWRSPASFWLLSVLKGLSDGD